nr:ethD domain containing protein [Trichoderma psychrophilum]
MASSINDPEIPELNGSPENKYLCLTICGYRKPGMSEEDYRNHMVNVSAPMTKHLMVKYGVKRWTQIHNQASTRALMGRLFDSQMARVADFDCFSQVFFKSVDDYKRMKEDPWYKEHLVGDHEKFADTKRSMMTIGWVEEYIREGEVVQGFSGGD